MRSSKKHTSHSSDKSYRKITDFPVPQVDVPSFDIRECLAPFRENLSFPLGFHGRNCPRCGRQLVKFGDRKTSSRGSEKKFWCSKCRETRTPGWNRYSHLPDWAVDQILFSKSIGKRNFQTLLDVEREGNSRKDPLKISVPTMYNVLRRNLDLLDKFERIALRGLSVFPIGGTWCMDIRYHDRPFGQTDDRRKGHPHMFVAVVIDEKSGYAFSCCVSRKRDHILGLKAFVLALDRAGIMPQKLKIDYAEELFKAANTVLPLERIERVNKEKDFAFNNSIERWFSHLGTCFNKHACEYRRPETLECCLNIYRYRRNYLMPYKQKGITPAELLGLVLPRRIKDEVSFIPLLEFSDRIIDFVEGEAARRKNLNQSR